MYPFTAVLSSGPHQFHPSLFPSSPKQERGLYRARHERSGLSHFCALKATNLFNRPCAVVVRIRRFHAIRMRIRHLLDSDEGC